MTSPPGADPAQIVIDTKQVFQTSNVHLNIRQELIITTEDKLRLCLRDTVERLGDRQAWWAPLGIVVTLLIGAISTSFRDFIVKKEVWEAIAIIATILVVVWLIRSLLRARKAPTLDSVVTEIKRDAVKAEPQNSAQAAGA